MTEQHRFTLRSAIHAAVLMFMFIFAVGLLPLAVAAQGSAQTPPLAGIAHIAIRVRSLEASRDFYNKLGFEEAFNLSKDGQVYESFIKINDHQFIELYPATAKDPAIGFLHVCFEGDDLQAIHDDYANRGLPPTPVRKAGAGNLLFTMVGPEKQNIEYTQYMPGSLHSNDQGKHVSDDRIAEKLISVSLAMKDPMAARDFYINQLAFKPIAGDTMFLHMPGNSGQEVEIAQPSLGPRARFILQTHSLGKAVRRLHKEHISPEKPDNYTVSFRDPDGNIITLDSH